MRKDILLAGMMQRGNAGGAAYVINWTPVATMTGIGWRDIIWAGGTIQRWVAVGNGNRVAYSSNGSSWTTQTVGFTTQQWLKAAYSPDKDYIAMIGDQSTPANVGRSGSGSSWVFTSASFGGLSNLGYSNAHGMWIALAGVNPGVSYSTDATGNTWTTGTGNLSGGSYFDMAEGPAGQVVSVGSSTVAVTTNGTSWVANASVAAFNAQRAVVYVPRAGRYYATGTNNSGSNTNVAYSSNGTTWINSAESGLVTAGNGRYVGVANDEEHGLTVAVGSGGATSNLIEGRGNGPLSWTNVAGIPTEPWVAIDYSPEQDRFVAVAQNGSTYGVLVGNVAAA